MALWINAMVWTWPGSWPVYSAVDCRGESQVLNIYICLISPVDCHVYMFNMSPAYTQLHVHIVLVLIQQCHAVDGQCYLLPA